MVFEIPNQPVVPVLSFILNAHSFF